MVTTGPMSQVGWLRAAVLSPVGISAPAPEGATGRSGPAGAPRCAPADDGTGQAHASRGGRWPGPGRWPGDAQAGHHLAGPGEVTGGPGRLRRRGLMVARARRAPLRRAVSVGSRPTEPVMVDDVSPDPSCAASTAVVAASGPVSRGDRVRATGLKRPQCWEPGAGDRRGPLPTGDSQDRDLRRWPGGPGLQAAFATGSKSRSSVWPRRVRTSRVWVPIDPVDRAGPVAGGTEGTGT